MNRREWMKWCAFLGSFALAGEGASLHGSEEAPSRENMVLPEEIHIMNLSHTDFGYTDLPSTAWRIHEENIRLAIDYCRQTADYPADARFHWTIETLWPLERFFQSATKEELADFDRFVESGQINVTAMPCNITCLAGRHEWERELDRLAPIYQKYQPKAALQSDINGLGWGMVDSLYDRGIRSLFMAVNGSRTPVDRLSFFRWNGTGERTLMVYNGLHYCEAYNYFHDAEWRRGPVPARDKIWYHWPEEDDIFGTSDEEFARLRAIFEDRRDRLHNVGCRGKVLITMTNHRTMDNDHPCRQLSEFIRRWNDSGMTPKLVFSTPERYLRATFPDYPAMAPEEDDTIPSLCGEWGDWWGSGIASTPVEIALLQETQRRSEDIDRFRKTLAEEPPFVAKQADRLYDQMIQAEEHTWGAFDSIALPYCERTRGCLHEKMVPFYEASELSRNIQRDLLAGSGDYRRISATDTIEVLNPGEKTRSGWAEIAKKGLRFDADRAVDLKTGEVFPFDVVPEQTDPTRPVRGWYNNDAVYRFFVPQLAPGQSRRFRLSASDEEQEPTLTESRWFEPIFDDSGALINVRNKISGRPLFESDGPWRPGAIIREKALSPESVGDELMGQRFEESDFERTAAEVTKGERLPNFYGDCCRMEMAVEPCRFIEQTWMLYHAVPRIEITTSIWFPEMIEAQAFYMALPFVMDQPKIYYDSLGKKAEIGTDLLPNTCANFRTVGQGVTFVGDQEQIALTLTGAPLAMFDSITRAGAQTLFQPQTARYFSLFFENYWATNFAVMPPGLFTMRHVIEVGDAQHPVEPLENDCHWVRPVAETFARNGFLKMNYV